MAGAFRRIGLQCLDGVDPMQIGLAQARDIQANGKGPKLDVFQGDGLGAHAEHAGLTIKLPGTEFIFELNNVCQ